MALGLHVILRWPRRRLYAREGYAVLKGAGKGEGLDGMRKMLSAHFNRSRTAEVEEAVPVD